MVDVQTILISSIDQASGILLFISTKRCLLEILYIFGLVRKEGISHKITLLLHVESIYRIHTYCEKNILKL